MRWNITIGATNVPALLAAVAILVGVILYHVRAPEGRDRRALRALDCVREAPGAADRCLEALRFGDSLRAGMGP